MKYAAAPVTVIAVRFVAVWNLQSVFHQVTAGKGLSFKRQRFAVYAVEFVHGVHPFRIEPRHPYARKEFAAESLEFPPVKNGLGLVFGTIHHRCKVLALVRRDESIDVAELYYRTYLLVLGYGIAAEGNLFGSHILWLDLHSETAAHRNVNTVFDRYHPARLMVRRRADMRAHSYCRIEVGSSPLHIDALQGIGIVADPEFVKPREHAVIGTAAAGRAGLDGEVRVFGSNAVADLGEAAVEFDE